SSKILAIAAPPVRIPSCVGYEENRAWRSHVHLNLAPPIPERTVWSIAPCNSRDVAQPSGNRHPLRRVGIARRDHGGPESRFRREGGALRPGSFPVERYHLLVRRLADGSGRRGHAAGTALDHD